MLETKRFHDWRERLLDYIATREKMPFRYGKRRNDCCSFAAGAVGAMTGVDAMQDIPGYRGADSAGELLKTPLESFLDDRFPRVEIGMARCGDIGIAILNERATVVVIEGATLCGPGPSGLMRVPRASLWAAWRI